MELLVRLVVVWAVASVVVSLLLGLLIRRSEPVDALTRAPRPTTPPPSDGPTLAPGTTADTGVVVDLIR